MGAKSILSVIVGSYKELATYIWIPKSVKRDILILVPHITLDRLEDYFFSIRIKIFTNNYGNAIPMEYDFPLVVEGIHRKALIEPKSGLAGVWIQT